MHLRGSEYRYVNVFGTVRDMVMAS